mgnify:CR=1 FL=1
MSETIYEPFPDEEMSTPVTKGDIKNLATKTELKAELEFLRQTIKEEMAELPTKEDFSRLLNGVDKMTGQIKVYNDERSMEGTRLERIENWIKKAADAINIPISF